MAESFYYFGYGSNLLRQRLQLKNPSAVFVKPAKLENYRLQFGKKSKSWQGAVATVMECQGHHVWGAVWRMDIKHRQTLDNQEGVNKGWYRPIEIDVQAGDGTKFRCVSYQLTKLLWDKDPSEGFPPDKPSPHYKDVILRGAVDSGLPDGYVEGLRSIEDNGYCGQVELYESVMRSLRNDS